MLSGGEHRAPGHLGRPLEPQQLEKLPDEYADLMLTVSTLHEMRADQILHYLRVVDRLCGGAFYSKQWRRFYNDLDDITPTRETYPIPLRWSLVFERSALVPRTFAIITFSPKPAKLSWHLQSALGPLLLPTEADMS